MSNNRWKYNLVYSMEIEILTGLHIGGSNEELKIGGTDNPVITTRYIIDDEIYELPYIPGSSIKGKIRSLLESVGYTDGDVKDIVSTMFGPDKDSDTNERHTRIIIRDAFLEDSYIRNHERITEIKGENTINHITSEATPRFIERVRRGIKFKGQVILSIYEGDGEEAMKKCLETGKRLLEDSYLGGNGTRGYGSVKISISEPIKKGVEKYEEN